MKILALMFAATLLGGCSPKGALFLTIEGTDAAGPLAIPDKVDAVHVELTSPDRATTFFSKSYPLTAEKKFPLTLGIDAGNKTPQKVRVIVTLSKTDAPLGAAEALVAFTAGETTLATVRVVAGN